MGIPRPAVVGLGAAVVLGLLGVTPVAEADVVEEAITSILEVPDVGSPEQPEAGPMDGLQYADPAEGLDLMEAPTVDSTGAAHLTYPLTVPPGRLGVQPELTLEYDSRNANGWMGVGWELSVPTIGIDTRWGVPRYDADLETETYSFDGEQLSPTAHRSPQLPRAADRVFTKRVEGDHLRIIRHGDSPQDYWWEVQDKAGNLYFYGRVPDDDTLDEQPPPAVLTDDRGNVYSWPLVQMRDISLNTMSFFYEEVEDTGVGGGDQEGAPVGKELYVTRINYTGSIDVDDDDDGELPRLGPYDVIFTRDSELPGYERRGDVTIDGRNGGLRVTAELLKQVDVQHDGASVRSYHFDYAEGAFGKTLLQSVGTADANGEVYATHTLEYYDDVRSGGGYEGFESPRAWTTGNSDDESLEIGDGEATALGGSTTSSGDGRVYLGFNVFSGDKNGSVGGGVSFEGSNSESLVEMVDIDGDNLPDKLFRGGPTVFYRRNLSGPTGGVEFGEAVAIPSLPHLPEDTSFGASGGLEAYFFGGSVMYQHGWSTSTGTSYFEDVNGDGMVDFVDGSTIWFNHLEDGQPVFEATSANTAIPLVGNGSIDPDIAPDFTEEAAAQRRQFPLQDTVRRWIAPWDGDVTVSAPVNLVGASPDGVRVAIQHNGDELWSAAIPGGDTDVRCPPEPSTCAAAPLAVLPSPLVDALELVSGIDVTPDAAALGEGLSVHVERGDRLYFRVQPVDNGAGDQVAWNPVITYDDQDPSYDANGFDSYRYDAAEEFTLGGRTDVSTTVPLDGTLRLTGAVHKAGPTTDDVTVVVLRNGVVEAQRLIPAADHGDFPVVAELEVSGPSADGNDLGDVVELLLQVDSPIDASALSWVPDLFYTEAFDAAGEPEQTEDEHGNPIIRLQPPYDIELYPNSDLTAPQGTWTAPDDGDDVPGEEIAVTVEASATVAVDGLALPAAVTATVKSAGRLEAKGTLHLDAPPAPPEGEPPVEIAHDDTDLEFTAVEGTQYWFDLTSRDPMVGPRLEGEFELDDGADVPSSVWWPEQLMEDDATSAFPQSHRGWGYAGYNGDGDRAEEPIDEDAFVLHRDDFSDERPDGFDDEGFKDPVQASSYLYFPDPSRDRWRGPKDAAPTSVDDTAPRANARGATWGAAAGSSAARLGLDAVGGPGAGELLGGRAPRILGTGEQDAVAAGFSVGGIGLGFGVGWGRSRGRVDFMDLNGDAYPDVVGRGGVHYTDEVGNLEPAARDVSEIDDVRTNRETSYTFDGSGSVPAISAGSKGEGNSGGQDSDAGGSIPGNTKGKRSSGGGGSGGDQSSGKGAGGGGSPASGSGESGGGGDSSGSGGGDDGGDDASDTGAGMNIGFSGGLSLTQSNSTDFPNDALAYPDDIREEDLADLNGDGLADRITVDTSGEVEVAWNLGYRFSDRTAIWPASELEKGSGDSFSAGVSVGFNYGDYSFSGGVNLQVSEEHSDVVWTDVNGDGLPDRVESEVGSDRGRVDVNVRFNTGAGVSEEIDWGSFQGDEVSRQDTWGLGGGGDFTIGVGPLCWVVKLCYVIINPGGHGMKSVSGLSVTLRDVDGDGLLDSVSSDDDGSMDVARNRTGRTNLLRAVHRPLGATISLEYERDGNTLDQPYSLWVLSRVALDDGHAGDGADTQVFRYRYSGDAYFDFRERELYGHGHVVEEHLDEDGSVYRSIDRGYENRSYYARGLLSSETLRDGAGAPVRSTANTYELVDVTTGDPADATDTTGAAFPRLAVVEHQWFDGGDLVKQAQTLYEHDLHGNVVQTVDRGEPDDPTDDAIVDVTFTDCVGHESFPWTQVPERLLVTGADGDVLVRREADVPCDYAGIVTMASFNAPSGADPATTANIEVGYADPGGQTAQVIHPPNAEGDRYQVTTTFDPVTGQPIATEDSYGLRTTTTWDDRFGRIASVTDPNGATTSFTYDARGRLASVTNPFEQGHGPSITYEYHDTDPTPWARARHVDPANPGTTIDTVRFVDGLGREVQSKHDATVFTGSASPAADVMVVTGSGRFDAFGRIVAQHYAVTEPLGTAGVLNGDTDGGPERTTTTDWSVTDRVTRTTRPGGRITTNEHGYDSSLLGVLRFAVTETDPEGSQTVVLSDVRGNVVGNARRYVDGGQPKHLLTTYDHDPLQRLTEVVEQGGARTRFAYDLLGRNVATEGPDTGRTEVTYDLADNVVAEETANLRAAGQRTSYDYDHTRLTGVDHPNSPDVTYTYGAPGAPGNGAGRVVAVDDGARTSSAAYDALGNLVHDVTTMKVHNLSPQTRPDHTYTTTYAYDTWNRPLAMTYPDGEVVTYGYDSGGLVRSAIGAKAGATTPYVDRVEYDQDGHRRFLAYGNGITTEDTYDGATLELVRQLVLAGGAERQDLAYTYDKVGNVLTRVDDIPLPPNSEHGGPSAQDFTYDDLHRLTRASGSYRVSDKSTRTYGLTLSYDGNGRALRKAQEDRIDGRPQASTTYVLDHTYADEGHTVASIGSRTYTSDPDGNLTGWAEARGNRRRTMTWDDRDRLATVAEQGALTRYTYDDGGRLALEDGPQGEVERVNDFYLALNGAEAWKDVYVGDLRVALRRADNDGAQFLYYLTGDLTGSVNLVTAADGTVFEHIEYFPGGEMWVREKSNVFREPNLFAGQYFDEFRGIYNLGARWYDPRDGVLYSPDPALTAPQGLVDDPRLLDSYTYANSNPLRFVDPTGLTATAALQGFRSEFTQGIDQLRGQRNQLKQRAFKRFPRLDGLEKTKGFKRAAAVYGFEPTIEIKLSFTGVPTFKNLFSGFKKIRVKPTLELGGFKVSRPWKRSR